MSWPELYHMLTPVPSMVKQVWLRPRRVFHHLQLRIESAPLKLMKEQGRGQNTISYSVRRKERKITVGQSIVYVKIIIIMKTLIWFIIFQLIFEL